MLVPFKRSSNITRKLSSKLTNVHFLPINFGLNNNSHGHTTSLQYYIIWLPSFIVAYEALFYGNYKRSTIIWNRNWDKGSKNIFVKQDECSSASMADSSHVMKKRI